MCFVIGSCWVMIRNETELHVCTCAAMMHGLIMAPLDKKRKNEVRKDLQSTVKPHGLHMNGAEVLQPRFTKEKVLLWSPYRQNSQPLSASVPGGRCCVVMIFLGGAESPVSLWLIDEKCKTDRLQSDVLISQAIMSSTSFLLFLRAITSRAGASLPVTSCSSFDWVLSCFLRTEVPTARFRIALNFQSFTKWIQSVAVNMNIPSRCSPPKFPP